MFLCKICDGVFHSVCIMREHKLRDLGEDQGLKIFMRHSYTLGGSGAQNIHATIVSGDVDNNKLTEELRL